MNQNPPSAEVATPAEPVVCVQPLDSAAEVLRTPEFVNQEAAFGAGAGRRTRAEQPEPKAAPPAPPPQPLCRWSDEHRQEALDLHCRLHKLPPAKLAQASGIPDPKNMTPRDFVERARPYCISIDRSAEEDRLWKLGQHRFDELQAEMLRER